jgi:hypothetical protein
MTAAYIMRRGSSPISSDSATHLFKVGQSVRLKGGFGLQSQAGEIYRITGTLPLSGNFPQYRIRNDAERHERVTTQDNLEPIRASAGRDGDALSEITFGHGEGTGAQQRRDPKTEAEKSLRQG